MHTVITCIKHMRRKVLTGTTVAMVRCCCSAKKPKRELLTLQVWLRLLILVFISRPNYGPIVLERREITPPTPDITAVRSVPHTHTHKAMFPQVTLTRPIIEGSFVAQSIFLEVALLRGTSQKEKRKEGNEENINTNKNKKEWKAGMQRRRQQQTTNNRWTVNKPVHTPTVYCMWHTLTMRCPSALM